MRPGADGAGGAAVAAVNCDVQHDVGWFPVSEQQQLLCPRWTRLGVDTTSVRHSENETFLEQSQHSLM